MGILIIMMFCFYVFIIENLSLFFYKSFTYNLFVGFLIGLIISKFISLKFSQFKWDKGGKQ